MSRVRRFLCSIGFHSPLDRQEEWCIASLYRREVCKTCDDVAYFVIGMGGVDRVKFVPPPWDEEENE